jgi:hypothetical protein
LTAVPLLLPDRRAEHANRPSCRARTSRPSCGARADSALQFSDGRIADAIAEDQRTPRGPRPLLDRTARSHRTTSSAPRARRRRRRRPHSRRARPDRHEPQPPRPRSRSRCMPLGRHLLLRETVTPEHTLKKRTEDVLAYFHRPSTSNGPTKAINGRIEHLRGPVLGLGNLTSYIARSLLETGGFKPQLHPRL